MESFERVLFGYEKSVSKPVGTELTVAKGVLHHTLLSISNRSTLFATTTNKTKPKTGEKCPFPSM